MGCVHLKRDCFTAVVCVTAVFMPSAVFSQGGDGNDKAVLVFAAASTTEVIGKIAAAYEKETGVKVVANFASSSTLAKQIEAGGRADIFLSAAPEWMDELQKRSLIQADSRVDLLGNQLVLIAPRGKGFKVEMKKGFDFAKAFEGRLAMGDPDHVPAGKYGKQALRSMGWWDSVAKRVIPAMDVRSALHLVEMGEAGAGIAYATDAAVTDKVQVVASFPDDSHDRVRYPVALCKGAGAAASDFLAFLKSEEASAVFARAGFSVLIKPVSPENDTE